MVTVSSLPRDPIQALEIVLAEMIAAYGGTEVPIQILRDGRHPIYLDLVTNTTIANKSAQRIKDDYVRDLAIEYLRFNLDEKLSDIAARMSKILEAVIALHLDDHFLNPEDVATYDNAALTKADRLEIRELMARARHLTQISLSLSNGHKLRVNHRITQVENELYKELSAFGTVMAAAYEVSALFRQIGGDVQPIAEAIEKARTITEKHVVGYQQIEADPTPKALPKPDETDGS